MLKSFLPAFATLLFATCESYGAPVQIELAPGAAALKGSVSYSAEKDILELWNAVGSVATWKVDYPGPGRYTVTIVYSLLGAIEGKRQFSISTGSDTQKIVSVKATDDWEAFTHRTLVPLKVSSSDKTFSIVAIAIPRGACLMNLKKVVLTKEL